MERAHRKEHQLCSTSVPTWVTQSSNSLQKEAPNPSFNVTSPDLKLLPSGSNVLEHSEGQTKWGWRTGGGPEFLANSYTFVKTPCTETTTVVMPSVILPSDSLMSLHLLLYHPVSFYMCVSSFHPHLSDSSH